MPVHDSSHRVFLRRTYLLPYSSSIVAPVTYALIRIPNPAPPPRINDGISSNKPSAPQEASRNRATTATPTPIAVQPELILLLLEMNRVCLNCRHCAIDLRGTLGFFPEFMLRYASSWRSQSTLRDEAGVSRPELFVGLYTLTLVTRAAYYLEIAWVVGASPRNRNHMVDVQAGDPSAIPTVDTSIVLPPHQYPLQPFRPSDPLGGPDPTLITAG